MELKEQIDFVTRLYNMHMNEFNRPGVTTEEKMDSLATAQKFNEIRQSLLRLEHIKTIANAV